MKDQKNQGPSAPTVIFLSWFYTGKFPKAPGTMGSLATLPLIYLLHAAQINTYSLLALIVVLFGVAVFLTEKVQQAYGLHDPQWIVIDEVIGMLITWSFVPEFTFTNLLLVFTFFRIFDIVKIWPASYFDRLHHGVGTITDDVISGVYAGILVRIIREFI
jgi:phosphatidylglycerophosphatase A